MNLNKLLVRQIQKHFGGLENVSPDMHDFLLAVTEAYDHYEKDHSMLERSIDLSSGEMIELNKELREETKKLRAAHHELKTLFENIDETFFSVDMRSNKLTQMSPSCEKTYGYRPDEFFSLPDLWRDTIHPEDKQVSEQQLQDLFIGKKVVNNYRIIHKNGSEKWIENRVIPTLDEEGVLIRIDGVTSDITERKKAEKLLIESEKKYRLVFENPFLGVALGTIDGLVMNANKAFYTLLGYTQEEIQNIHFSKFTYAPDLDKELPYLQSMANGEINDYVLEKRYVTKSNEIIWVELSLSCVKDEAQQIQFVIAVIQDITSKKHAKESLLKSEANLRNILENTDTGYILLNTKGDILSYNTIAQQMGMDEMKEKLGVGKNYVDLMIEEKKTEMRRKIGDVLTSGEQIKDEVCYPQPDNSLKWFYISMHPVFSEDRKVIGLSIAATDITSEKTLSIERDKITSDLMQRNRDLEQFAFIISHNLRSPVANIIGLINVIENSPTLNGEDRKECMNGLLLSANKLDSVIKDLSHILQVRREISEKKEPILFSELVSDIKISIGNLLQKESAVIHTDFTETDKIITLKSYLYSIFFNLISNSIKYRNGESPVITIASRKVNNKVMLTFKDNGIGIDLATQGNKIFGLYNKFHFHTEGKGIGLYMTKTQVEMLGGKITVVSSVNKGTEFQIELQE
ncbi:MAG: kinE 2 [Bacteroidetes bacterium]|jgi:PAS domain S-box-containing protein|nr:kinE 2 [Bacteroidota bacterium]